MGEGKTFLLIVNGNFGLGNINDSNNTAREGHGGHTKDEPKDLSEG